MNVHFGHTNLIGLYIVAAYILQVCRIAVPWNPSVSFICAKTTNPIYCERVVNSDSRSATANSAIIGDIFIDLTFKNASATAIYLFDNIRKVWNGATQERYKACHKKMHNMMANMYASKLLWHDRSIVETKEVVSENILGLREICKGKRPSVLNHILAEYIEHLIQHLHIIDVVVDFVLENQ